MRPGLLVKLGLLLVAALGTVALAALAEARSKLPDDPMFIRWLKPGEPGDETIRVYWAKVLQDEATPAELVDLGTMLFHRGYPKDAVRMYRRALDADKKTYEAWFRIGLVEHRQGNLRAAEKAYRKCLKHLTGHGWCNFYMGRLQEEFGNTKKALYHYRRAYKFAPELAWPEVNPEVLYSKLQFGAAIKHAELDRFTALMPMTYVEPLQVKRIRSAFEPKIEEPVEPEPEPVAKKPEPKPEPEEVEPAKPEPKPAPADARRTIPGRPEVGRVVRPAPQEDERAQGEDEGLLRVRRPPRRTAPRATPPPSVSNVSPEAQLRPLWETPLERAARSILEEQQRLARAT